MSIAATSWTGRDTGDWQPGDLIDAKYEIEARLGAGAMGVVYRARHVDLDVRVALKVMRSELDTDGLSRERMLREARAAAALRHHNVVRVLDVGRLPNGLPFIVMEYLEGENLEQRLRRQGALSVVEALDYVIQTCNGIAEAHERGIVHRDLKPENLFLARQPDGSDAIKVFDFGISKQLGSQALRATRPFDTVGSPVYMSPEQMNPQAQVDARSDIWSLGVVLTELCTHELPFAASSLPELCQQITGGTPRLPGEYLPTLPAALDDIVKRCLERDPALRFPSAANLADALRAVLQNEGGRVSTRASGWQLARTELQPSTAPSTQSILPAQSSRAQQSLRTSEAVPRSSEKATASARSQRKNWVPVLALGLAVSAVLAVGTLFSAGTDTTKAASSSQDAPLSVARLDDAVAPALPAMPAEPAKTPLASPQLASAALGPIASPPPTAELTRSAVEAVSSGATSATTEPPKRPRAVRGAPPARTSSSSSASAKAEAAPPTALSPERQPWDLSAFGGRR